MFKNPHLMMKYLLIIMAAAFAMPSMAEEDAPKRMTSAEEGGGTGQEARLPQIRLRFYGFVDNLFFRRLEPGSGWRENVCLLKR